MSGDEFAGQTAVVVGGVACLDRNFDGDQESVDALGPDAIALEMDVTDDRAVVAAIGEAERRLGPIAVLVNCAGITGVTDRRSQDVDIEDFDLVCRINLRGAFLLSRAVLPRMVSQGYGRVLHVASIAGKEGNAGMGPTPRPRPGSSAW